MSSAMLSNPDMEFDLDQRSLAQFESQQQQNQPKSFPNLEQQVNSNSMIEPPMPVQYNQVEPHQSQPYEYQTLKIVQELPEEQPQQFNQEIPQEQDNYECYQPQEVQAQPIEVQSQPQTDDQQLQIQTQPQIVYYDNNQYQQQQQYVNLNQQYYYNNEQYTQQIHQNYYTEQQQQPQVYQNYQQQQQEYPRVQHQTNNSYNNDQQHNIDADNQHNANIHNHSNHSNHSSNHNDSSNKYDDDVVIHSNKKSHKNKNKNRKVMAGVGVGALAVSNQQPQGSNLAYVASNVSTYCCLGLYSRNDNCCHWMCDSLIYCLTWPIRIIAYLIKLLWNSCLNDCCSAACPSIQFCCSHTCSLLTSNCSRCFNGMRTCCTSSLLSCCTCCQSNCTCSVYMEYCKGVTQFFTALWHSYIKPCVASIGGCLSVIYLTSATCCVGFLSVIGECCSQIPSLIAMCATQICELMLVCCDFSYGACSVCCKLFKLCY